MFPVALLRTSLLETIKNDIPSFTEEGYICSNDLRKYRNNRIEELLREEKGELNQLEKEVLRSYQEHELLAEDLNARFDKNLTIGERLSDKIAKFGGSWKFISIFISVIIIWMAINTFVFIGKAFDPYPYILLNLFLSCLAAIQAPIIMMSQNRQAAKDRLQSDYEYTTNLKAELEVRQLHAKLDQFMKKHWGRLLEIQQMQLDVVEDILEKNNHKDKKK